MLCQAWRLRVCCGMPQKRGIGINKLHDGRLAERPPPKAVTTKGRPAWLLWLIPLGVAALCAWFMYRDFVAAGPLITIYFQNVEGLEEGKNQ
jgi:hypothetical protein